MKLPVRIFSDLHLGHRASRIDDVEKLRPLFQGAGTVLFNGDTWEELSPPWLERSAEMLGQLRRLLADEGRCAVFLPGNHDPGWEGSGFMELAEGRIAITHGDALLRNGAPWKREMLSNPEVIDELWRRFPGAATEIGSRLELARTIARRMATTHPPNGRSLLARVVDAAFPPPARPAHGLRMAPPGRQRGAFLRNLPSPGGDPGLRPFPLPGYPQGKGQNRDQYRLFRRARACRMGGVGWLASFRRAGL